MHSGRPCTAPRARWLARDFFYFASVIGTSGQTADVSFVSKPMRRIGSLHCILAYRFNTMVLALLINIGASML